MKVLFIEPPKEMWFMMGEYLPPPLGILQLAAYLEAKNKEVEIKVLDCQARKLDWPDLEKEIASFRPDIVASSSLATCNAYLVARTVELAKKVDPSALTVVGGQHFTALDVESLKRYREIDVVVRGEGEQTLVELVKAKEKKFPLSKIKGISYRKGKKIVRNPDRPMIKSLDDLPFPGYHFVGEDIKKYHFSQMMGRGAGYALIEGSRGCPHRCTFCSQWCFWRGTWRKKSPKRIAEEMELLYRDHGIKFLWLTDDNLGLDKRTSDLCEEIIARGLGDKIAWFMMVRVDDVIKAKDMLPKLRQAGLRWVLVGIESHSPETLGSFNKGINPEDAKKAFKFLKENGIFSQATIIIGERKDTTESIVDLRKYVDDINPDLAIFMILTPFPGAKLYEISKRHGWLEEENWANYDMSHAIMPTETLSRNEVQKELYRCYRGFYGSTSRKLSGIFSRNPIKRRTYRYMVGQGILAELRNLFR